MNIIKFTSVIAAIAIVLSGCGGKGERIAEHLKKGHEYYSKQDYEKARIEFKNVLQINPKNSEAMYSMGKVYEKMQNWQKAGQHYLTVVQELDPNNIAAIRDLGLIYMMAGQIDKSEEMAQKAIKLAPQDASVLTFNASLDLRKNDLDDAEKLTKQALEIKPWNPDAVMVLASVYARNKNESGAVQLIKTAIDHNKEHVGLKSELIKYYIAKNDSENAISLIQDIIRLRSDDFNIRKQLARYYAKLKRNDDAEKVLVRAIHDLPDNMEAKVTLADFQYTFKGKETAEKTLKDYINEYPDEYVLRFSLAKLYASAKDQKSALKVYQDIIDKDRLGPNGLKARNNIAVYDLENNEVDAALALVSEVLKENVDDIDALIIRGDIAMKQNDVSTAIANYRTVLREKPAALSIMKKLASAHVKNNNLALAEDVLKQAVKAYPNDIETLYQLGQLKAHNKQYEEAISLYNRILKIDTENKLALGSLVRAQLSKQDFNDALASANNYKNYFPDDALGDYFEGLALQGQGKTKSSIKEYELALEKSPNAIEPLAALIKTYTNKKQYKQALEQLNKVLNKNPKHVVALNMKGEVMLAEKKKQQAEQVFTHALQIDPKFPLLYRNLATVKLLQKDIDSAIDTYKRGIEATDHEPRLVYDLASLYEKMGKMDSAIDQYDSLYKKDPTSMPVANNMAMLLVTYKNDQISYERAKSLIGRLRHSKNPSYLDTVGWVLYKNGEYESAITSLKDALQKAPNQPILHYHLGMAYYSNGNMKLAKQNLEIAVNNAITYAGKDEAKKILSGINS